MPWEMAEFLPPHAVEDVPWDRPAELPWPEPELDALAWNERWNTAAYDPDYPIPPVVARAPVATAVAARDSAGAPRPRFGRPARPSMDAEFDDPYDEYAPLADDLDAPGQLAWTGGTVPLRPVASFDGSVPDQPPPFTAAPPPRPSVEPPTWSRSPRSVFGDYFGKPGRPAPSLPTPDRPATSAADVPVPLHTEARPAPAQEYPPVPTDFKPQWASVAPVRPVWSAEPIPTKATAAPAMPPTWVQSTAAPPATTANATRSAPSTTTTPAAMATPAPAAARLLPAPPPPAATPRETPPNAASLPDVGVLPAAASLPAAAPLLAVPLVTPAAQARQAVASSSTDSIDDAEDDGPSTVTTLALMVLTGIVVVGLVLAFLHFMTGLFR